MITGNDQTQICLTIISLSDLRNGLKHNIPNMKRIVGEVKSNVRFLLITADATANITIRHKSMSTPSNLKRQKIELNSASPQGM